MPLESREPTLLPTSAVAASATQVAASVISTRGQKSYAPGRVATPVATAGTRIVNSSSASKSLAKPVSVSVALSMVTQQIIARCQMARRV